MMNIPDIINITYPLVGLAILLIFITQILTVGFTGTISPLNDFFNYFLDAAKWYSVICSPFIIFNKDCLPENRDIMVPLSVILLITVAICVPIRSFKFLNKKGFIESLGDEDDNPYRSPRS